ncbi:MAG: rod shape-determining protein MreD [Oscillospiraceae bacterium]|nr:rod shape-determining protein MreD [Oscillospiraceae bacterium]
MKKKSLIILILLHSLLLMVVYVFQGMIFPFMRLNGLVPLLLPTAAAGVALYEGRDIGGITGLFAGILCDISFNQPVGVFTVFLTITGLVVGALADTIVLRGFITYYIITGIVLVVSVFVQVFPFLIILDNNITIFTLLPTAIEQTIYSLILALPIWFFIRALGNWTDKLKG